MQDNRQTIKGTDNNQVIGNNNLINSAILLFPSRPLSHSLIHELLDIVYSLPSSQDDSYSLTDPAQINAKLRFNNALRYISLIENHFDDYVRVDEVINEYPDSEDIIKKLRDMFLEVASFDDQGNPCVGEGDTQLDKIKDRLCNIIKNDVNFDPIKHPDEKIEQFCIALIAYGVSKCKILEKPI